MAPRTAYCDVKMNATRAVINLPCSRLSDFAAVLTIGTLKPSATRVMLLGSGELDREVVMELAGSAAK
ncbi:MAG: hypothetical protein U1F16_04465 [Turneriella sp.]